MRTPFKQLSQRKVAFLSIFVADTKLIYGYNFVAPLDLS